MVQPSAQIFGKIIRLLDSSGGTICEINEDYTFNTFCEGRYGIDGDVNETRFLYLPLEFVRDYAVDASMGIEVVLDSLIYDYGGGSKQKFLYTPKNR